ncbi:hypothetical protein L1887_15833 [Cichorium endivia]|nr:hypothetical protein L1887_15833 [Cichorium endivia]
MLVSPLPKSLDVYPCIHVLKILNEINKSNSIILVWYQLRLRLFFSSTITVNNSSSTSKGSLPLATILHMITIHLSSFAKSTSSPSCLLKLTGYVDGSSSSPPPINDVTNISSINTDYIEWLEADHRVFLIVQYYLTKDPWSNT